MDEIRRLGGEGILVPQDVAQLKASVGRVYELMKDGAWYTREEIEYAAGGKEGMRRMRQLRQYFEIQRMRVSLTRTFLYRLATKPCVGFVGKILESVGRVCQPK